MAFKRSGPGDDPRIDEHEAGVTWIPHPDERMQRASHALNTDAGTWIVDPIDAAGVDDKVSDVAGVVVGLDRHARDAAAFARRNDVAVHVPAWLSGVERRLGPGVTVERFDGHLPGTRYRARRVVDWPVWGEAAFHREADGTLVVPEAVGTADYFRTDGERLGVHPMLRAVPPRSALDLAPRRVLTGHGPPVLDGATAALDDALTGARRRAPSLYLDAIRSVVG